MKIRMLVLVLLAVSAASAFAADDKKKGGDQAAESSAKPTTKVRSPKYILETKAGSIAIYDDGDEPANPKDVENTDNDGAVSWIGKDGLVHRAYTEQHLAKIRATFGDAIGDLAQEAHDVGGRTRISDALNLKRALEIIGASSEESDAIVRDYLKNPNGKKRDDVIEDALADNKLIPGGLKGTGRTLGDLLELVRDHAILGGDDPTKGLTPGFVKGFDDVKHGRKSITDFLAEFGPGLGQQADAGTDPNESDPNESPTDPNDGDDGTGDELGGGFQDEDHSDTERGDDDPTDPPGDDQGSSDNGGNAPDQGGEDPDAGGGTTYTVDSVTENGDGTTSYVFHVEGSDGDDGSYTTTYYDDGTYVTTDNDSGEVVGSGTGTPPDKVQPGDSTTTTQGDEAIFPTEEEEEEETEEEETEETPSTEFTPAPDGEGAPLPDEVQSVIDAIIAADIAKLKGNGGSEGDDDNCGGDGKHKLPAVSTKISVAEAAAIEQARKLKMIGNPEGVDHHGIGDIGEVPSQQDNGDIDYGPDHVDPREGSGVSRVDPRGTKKIGADHHNDDPGQKEGHGTAGPGASGSGGSSSSSDDSSKGASKVKQIGAAAKLKKVDATAKVKAAAAKARKGSH